MRGLLQASLLLAPALATAFAVPHERHEHGPKYDGEEEEHVTGKNSASRLGFLSNKFSKDHSFALIGLDASSHDRHSRPVPLRLDVFPIDAPCGSANITIDGHPLATTASGDVLSGKGSLTTEKESNIKASWTVQCIYVNGQADSQFLKFAIESVDGKNVKDLGFSSVFKQTGTTEIVSIKTDLHVPDIVASNPNPEGLEPATEDDEFHGHNHGIEHQLHELQWLHAQLHELHLLIAEKEEAISQHATEHYEADVKDCDSLKCIVKAVAKKAKHTVHEMYGHISGDEGEHRGPPGPPGPPGHGEHRPKHPKHEGKHEKGNHTHGNHTGFPHHKPHKFLPICRLPPHGPPGHGPPGEHHGPPPEFEHHGPPPPDFEHHGPGGFEHHGPPNGFDHHKPGHHGPPPPPGFEHHGPSEEFDHHKPGHHGPPPPPEFEHHGPPHHDDEGPHDFPPSRESRPDQDPLDDDEDFEMRPKNQMGEFHDGPHANNREDGPPPHDGPPFDGPHGPHGPHGPPPMVKALFVLKYSVVGFLCAFLALALSARLCASKQSSRKMRREQRRARRRSVHKHAITRLLARLSGHPSSNDDDDFEEKQAMLQHVEEGSISSEITQLVNAAEVVEEIVVAEVPETSVMAEVAPIPIAVVETTPMLMDFEGDDELPAYEDNDGSEMGSMVSDGFRYTPGSSNYSPGHSASGSVNDILGPDTKN